MARRRIGLASIGVTVGLALVTAAAPALAAPDSEVSVRVSGGRIMVSGDAGDNYAHLYAQTAPSCPGGSPCYEVGSADDVVLAQAPCVVSGSGPTFWTARCPSVGIEGISLIGGEGGDYLKIGGIGAAGLEVPALVDGGAGDDYLRGSLEADSIIGGLGDDRLGGAGGDDTLSGGEGDDNLYGAVGDDTLDAGRGGDYLYGRSGVDRLVGGLGADHLTGGLGPDMLFGSRGADYLAGSRGRDLCDGGEQADFASTCELLRNIP